MTRATSTVLDVTLFLLLVSASAAVVVTDATQPSAQKHAASESATVLATTTASVEYELTVPGDEPSWVANASDRRRRTAHGTVADLLGDATMSRVGVDGRRLSTAGRAFEREVARVTRAQLAGRQRRASVRVEWEPYPDAPIAAGFQVGPAPPPGRDVQAATLTVESGVENVTRKARTAARSSGYYSVARTVASAVVEGLFPPDRSRIALQGDYPADALTAARYRQLGRLTDSEPLPVESTSTTRLNRALTAALADVLAADLRRQFTSPTAAAQAVETDRVRITVRTWSP